MKRTLICLISVLLCFCFLFASCSENNENTSVTTHDETITEATSYSPAEKLTYQTSIGNGETEFGFEIIDFEGKKSEYLVKTEKAMLADALSELGLLTVNESSGEITDVFGIHAEYNKDGMHWVLYIGDEAQKAPVNSIKIIESTVYTFKLER